VAAASREGGRVSAAERPQKPVWRRMPQLAHGLVRSCCRCRCRCQLLRRGSAQTVRRVHWLCGLLLACICLTLGGLFNAELPVSVAVVPSYALEHTVNNIRTAETDLDIPVRNYSLIPKWKLRLYTQIVRDETLEIYQISGLLRSSDLVSLFLASSHDQYLICYDPNFRNHKWTSFNCPFCLYTMRYPEQELALR